MKINRSQDQISIFIMSIFMTAATLCILPTKADAAAPFESVKIKLSSFGTGWFRFVERSNQSNLILGMGELECDGQELLYSRRIKVSDEKRPPSTWLSNYRFKENSSCVNGVKNIISNLHNHLAEISWSESGKPEFHFLEEALDNGSQQVLESMKLLRADYRTSKIINTPELYYTGSKTKYAYIYIHGLFMNQRQFQLQAEQSFENGINSIVAVLPGHESDSFDDMSLYSEDDWITYSHHLVAIAKNLGEKVIVVGHSAGGLIAFRLGLEKKVDGVILIQPALGLTFKSSLASFFGGIGKVFLKNDSNLAPIGGRMVARLIEKTINCKSEMNFQVCDNQLKYDIPTIVYMDPKDDVVDSSATEKVMQFFKNTKVEIISHSYGHMYIPNFQASKTQ